MPKNGDTEDAKKIFDVFLSHNSADKPEVRRLADALEARALRVWLAERELIPGRPWLEALEQILETTWHDREMRSALSQFVRRELSVIPVLLPGAAAEPELPLFLEELKWVDLRDGLTAHGLDQVEWGITGKKPRPAPPATDLDPWLRHVHGVHSRPIATFRRHRGTALSHLYVELRIAEREAMELWRDQRRGGEKPASAGGRWTLEEVLKRETIAVILEKLHEKQKDDEQLQDWEARARVYRRIPELLGEAVAALDLLARLRQETSSGNPARGPARGVPERALARGRGRPPRLPCRVVSGPRVPRVPHHRPRRALESAARPAPGRRCRPVAQRAARTEQAFLKRWHVHDRRGYHRSKKGGKRWRQHPNPW